MQDQPQVIIIGAGPTGLATAASLTVHSIPYILLERDNCVAPLWQKHSYDRLHLHLRKQFCSLPHFPFPPSYPTYVSKDLFIDYLHSYVSHFNISPLYKRNVELATFNERSKKWVVRARIEGSEKAEEYSSRFLVVASGESSRPYVPEVMGLEGFGGEVVHSTEYRNGVGFRGRRVLVVGSGNSGMEIALDLANHGAQTSIVVRSPVHVLSRGIVHLGLLMLNYFSIGTIDSVLLLLARIVHGDLSKFGIYRPKEGPFFMKVAYGKYPVLDVGTVAKVKSGEIQVLPSIESINGGEVIFNHGKSFPYDVIVFCTGFKRSTSKWLEGDDYLLNEDGITKPSFPNHWKGKNGLYAIGLSRLGLYETNLDAQNIAKDIKSLIC